MNDKTTEAIKLALNAPELGCTDSDGNEVDLVTPAITALGKALANTRQSRPGPAIQECYGDCPTSPETCLNPCKFEGRPKPLAQHKIEEQTHD
jgi:hypothetical protein